MKKGNRRNHSKPKKSNLKKQVHRIVRSMVDKPELKFQLGNQSGSAATNLATTGILPNMQPTVQGIDKDNYESGGTATGTVLGLNYIAKYIHANLLVYNQDTVTHFFRVILIRNDTPAVYKYAYNGGSNYRDMIFSDNNPLSLYTQTGPPTYKVLYDRIHTLEQNGDNSVKILKLRINLHNTKISNTLNLASADNLFPDNHGYQLFLLSDSAYCEYTINWRFAFTDA